MKNKTAKILTSLALAYFLLPIVARAATYDFYVDKNSSEVTENGSAQYPYKTIKAALEHIENTSLHEKTVFIKNATYRESIDIMNDTSLVGESENNTIIDADDKDNAVNFVGTKSKIQNMTIKGADSTNVIVDKKSKATIEDCRIKKAGKYGIYVKESSTAEKYKFTLKDSEVSESKAQGVYIFERKISVSGNEIFENGGEGIDLHQGVKGTVSKNNIHENEESGIEAILSGAKLTIKNNKVLSNQTQGITVQIYSKTRKGKVKLSGNTIKKNHSNGIRFANYTHSLSSKAFRVFADKYIKLSKNKISSNGKAEIYYE